MPLPGNPASTAASAASSAGVLPAGMGASLQGVSAHGLVSLERAEEILQRVIDTVNEQGLQISSLYLLLQTLVGTETQPLPNSLLNLEGNFYRVTQRLEKVEKAIHVPGVAPSVSIGEVVSTNGVELNHALDALSKKANQAEVLARQQKLEKEVAEVYAWAGARELVERLEESNRATRTQVQAMEAALGCKVDKAELAGMEATLSRLRAFNARVDTLERAQAEGMAGLRQDIQVLQDKMAAATHQLEVAQQSLESVEEKHGAWRRETVELLKEVEGELASTASLEQLDGKLDARVWDRHWRVACERLDKKADLPELAALLDKVDGLEEDLVRLGRESDVYSRFVEWYYARGQAHEYNLQTLDRTLGRLSKEALEKYLTRGRPEGMGAAGGVGGGGEGEEESSLIFSSSSSEGSSRRSGEGDGGGDETHTLSPVA